MAEAKKPRGRVLSDGVMRGNVILSWVDVDYVTVIGVIILTIIELPIC